MEVNKHTIESLAPRVKMLSESLSDPVPLGDFNEREGGKAGVVSVPEQLLTAWSMF